MFFLFSCKQVVDDASDENHTVTPVIYEDNDESDDEESEDAMETDQDSKEEEASDGLSDIEGIDGMSEWWHYSSLYWLPFWQHLTVDDVLELRAINSTVE